MVDRQELLKEIGAALERDPAVNTHENPISLQFDNDTLVLEGEVRHISAKRRAKRITEDFDGVRQVDDRVRVLPAEAREDGAIRDSVANSLARESAFHECSIRVWNKNQMEMISDASDQTSCFINVVIENGVVSLWGEVISLSHKRLAGLLAWWAPGSLDVVNDLRVVPAEEDGDHEITDAILMALSKDPLVHADQIRVFTRNGEVTLEGAVQQETERQMAEDDVWYLYDVKMVHNRIAVIS